ncbi:MAG: HD domain-containing protein [Firmicutes bacterium]|nr:HD domain-containing protein [Bacillota bacterium]
MDKIDLMVLLREISLVKDAYLKAHQSGVAYYAGLIATKVCPAVHDLVFVAALNHDVGKAFVTDEILFKPDKLTYEEWAKMKEHPVVGAQFFARENGCRLSREEKEVVRLAILYHHERWDGKGYPEGLKGKDIPLEARIIAVADAYDAMTTDRPYRKALTGEEAAREILSHAGNQFDPRIADVFAKLLEKKENRRKKEESREEKIIKKAALEREVTEKRVCVNGKPISGKNCRVASQ